jgi:hypothetical protein
MRRLLVMGMGIVGLVFAGCTGGAAGEAEDDIGDIFVIGHSPGNGAELDTEDSLDQFNALNNPTLMRPQSVIVIFSNTVDQTSVIDRTDPVQETRNVRLFYFDTTQGPFDPNQPTVLGVNPPGANVIVPATADPDSINFPNDALIITPTGISASTPLPEGQYSVVVQTGVKGADGDGMKGAEYFFFFRVGQDTLGPVVVNTSPVPGARNVDPTTEVRITMSETILASTVNDSSLKVEFQPAGAAAATQIPGLFYTDGGNGPGNNFPNVQLDAQGLPGRSGVSPRNGVDIVFRPDLTKFPVNMAAEDPADCGNPIDPPRKGNAGFPLGQTITVSFVTTGAVITDTVGNPVSLGSPNLSFTFETKPAPPAVFAPNNHDAIYYGDTVGVGVIQIDPARTPYLVGPNPARQPNSVVTSGTGGTAQIVRVRVDDLVDLTSDSRAWSAFYSFVCFTPAPSLFMPMVYAASGAVGGGQIVVIDGYQMIPLGRFGTPSPGGVALTCINTTSGSNRLVVSNFSANTVTVYEVTDVRWFTGPTLPFTQPGLVTLVNTGASKLVLTEDDFRRVFPRQRQDVASPPGPPILGTVNVGVSPTKVRITGLPGTYGVGPALSNSPIVCALNAGENTIDLTELQGLNQSAAIEPDVDGINLSSQPTDVTWSPWSTTNGSYYFYIASVGGTVELFASGWLSNSPSVREGSATNTAPNRIINSVTGLDLPTSVTWIPAGSAAIQAGTGYTHAVLVTETGQNRVVEIGVTAESGGTFGQPTNIFEATNSNLAAGLGPVDVAGDPQTGRPNWPSVFPLFPVFRTYYVANAGEGTVRTGNYSGGVIGVTIPVPGVTQVVSWWSR